MTREEAIESLAENIGGQALAAVLAKGYDDKTLSVIAQQNKAAAQYFVDTKLSAESVNTIAVDEAALNDDRIVFDDYRLARSISELSKTPDWEDAKEFIKDYFGDAVQRIDADEFEHYYYMYQVDLRLACLRRLVNENYESFMNEVRHGTIDETIARAEEIVTKGNIKDFINEEIPGISVENYGALITICDPLDEIYTEWGKHRNLHTYSDIEKAIESAAEKICSRLEREKAAREQKPAEGVSFTDKTNYKPKKTRR